jgi:hypothetical protein
MIRTKINDGLTKWQRYRLKDLQAYRKRKREYARTPEERKKRTEYMRIWREDNREKHNAYSRNRYKRIGHTTEYKERTRRQRMQWEYGVTPEEYDKMSNRQNGKCLICGVIPKQRRLFHIDHDHKTKIVRGLLCSRCNGALGWFEKNEEKILEYLKQ